jgi:D-alanyl-D-alanine carboxypeptidase/D-alanyl-D-alanine-endopeptidase (penicillin-binding protein 4)
VTTALAYATLTGLDAPDAAGGASVRLDGRDVVLTGRGDARLSSAPGCVTDCLAQLADAIAAQTRQVRDVTGDAGWFPDERWPLGMSWNNIPTRSGTAVAALSLDDNELALEVMPGKPGAAPVLRHLGYVEIDNRAATVAGGKTDLTIDRLPFERRVRLTGTIAADAPPQIVRMGIDDPAHYAAWRFAALLRERRVKVTGKIGSRYDPPSRAPGELARLAPPPLAEDIRTINKVSQNLHAELLLRRVSRATGTGSAADGIRQAEVMFAKAGVPRTAWDLSDGSGMSAYNRVAPRGMVLLLRWIAAQPWGAAWRETLPVGGIDGTLARRFKETGLEGRIFAKTGSLTGTNALAGYLLGKSGRTLIFAAYANDVPGSGNATAQMDAALLAVADAN